MGTVMALRNGSRKFRPVAVEDFDPRVYTLAPGETLPTPAVDADGDGHCDDTGKFVEGNKIAAKRKWGGK